MTEDFSQSAKQMRLDVKNILCGLEAYRQDHRRYPEHFENLTEPIGYCLPLPKDPFNPNHTYRYKSGNEGKTFTLYSVGQNGEDNGGDPVKDMILVTQNDYYLVADGIRLNRRRF